MLSHLIKVLSLQGAKRRSNLPKVIDFRRSPRFARDKTHSLSQLGNQKIPIGIVPGVVIEVLTYIHQAFTDVQTGCWRPEY